MSKKIKKPYAAANALTGVITKRFKTVEKLVKHLYTPTHTIFGDIRPVDLMVVPVLITKETDEGVEVSPIEFTE